MKDSNEEMKLTYSSVMIKDGKPIVSVHIERGEDYADARLPECEIIASKGFSEDERKILEKYLKVSRKDILEKAKGITGILHML